MHPQASIHWISLGKIYYDTHGSNDWNDHEQVIKSGKRFYWCNWKLGSKWKVDADQSFPGSFKAAFIPYDTA